MTPEKLFAIALARGIRFDYGRPPREKPKRGSDEDRFLKKHRVVNCNDCYHAGTGPDGTTFICGSPMARPQLREIKTYPRTPAWCPGGRPVADRTLPNEEQTRSARPAGYSARELAMASYRMREESWRTLCWTWAGDLSAHTYLYAKLLELALAAKAHDGNWPESISRGRCPIDTCRALRCSHKYVEDLVTLALLELAHEDLYGDATRKAHHFGVHETTWRKRIARLYRAVQYELELWYWEGRQHLERNLRRNEAAEA